MRFAPVILIICSCSMDLGNAAPNPLDLALVSDAWIQDASLASIDLCPPIYVSILSPEAFKRQTLYSSCSDTPMPGCLYAESWPQSNGYRIIIPNDVTHRNKVERHEILHAFSWCTTGWPDNAHADVRVWAGHDDDVEDRANVASLADGGIGL